MKTPGGDSQTSFLFSRQLAVTEANAAAASCFKKKTFPSPIEKFVFESQSWESLLPKKRAWPLLGTNTIPKKTHYHKFIYSFVTSLQFNKIRLNDMDCRLLQILATRASPSRQSMVLHSCHNCRTGQRSSQAERLGTVHCSSLRQVPR